MTQIGDLPRSAGCSEAAISCILSDVHNVAILWEPSVIGALEEEFDLSPGSVMKAAFDSEIGQAATIGQLNHEQWQEQLCRQLPEDLVRRWLGYFGTPNAPYIAALKEAKSQGIRVGFVTNATSRLELELLRHGFDTLPDFIVASYLLGTAKPNQEFFRHAIRTAEIDVARLVYIDDDPKFLAAGAEAGLKTILYTSWPDVQAQLQLLGVHLG